jgi:hypothetical protein
MVCFIFPPPPLIIGFLGLAPSLRDTAIEAQLRAARPHAQGPGRFVHGLSSTNATPRNAVFQSILPTFFILIGSLLKLIVNETLAEFERISQMRV